MRAFFTFMPSGGHDLDGERRIPEPGGRLAVADLATVLALGRQEDLEPAQAVRVARQCVQGLDVVFLRESLAAASGVQG